jgi:hypothetical protein
VTNYLQHNIMFTPDQIALIEQIVDKRIALRKTRGPQRPYHTIPEIRELIVMHLPSLQAEIGNDEFDIAVLRHCLARKITLRDADLEYVGTEGNKSRRWEQQTLSALNLQAWPECPIIPGSRRRSYRFATVA